MRILVALESLHACIILGVGLTCCAHSTDPSPQEIAEKYCGSGISYSVKVPL